MCICVCVCALCVQQVCYVCMCYVHSCMCMCCEIGRGLAMIIVYKVNVYICNTTQAWKPKQPHHYGMVIIPKLQYHVAEKQ